MEDSNNLDKLSNHIEKVIIQLTQLNKEEINFNQLFSLTLESIEFIDNEYKNLNGSQKKDLLIEAMNDFCDHSDILNKDQKTFFKNFINKDLFAIIDGIIQVSNGEFRINEQQQMVLLRCLSKLCKFLFKKCMKQKKQTRTINNNP
jgi:hypothetical protein